MSISKFVVNYDKKDDKDHGYGYNLRKKMKNQKIEEKVEARSNLKKKTKTEKKEAKDEVEMIQISLPIELILEFLSRLPVKSLTRLSCASKYLYNYINQNPQFIKSHFINYSQKNPTLVFYTNYNTGKQQCLFKSLFHTRDIDENDNHDVQLCQKTIQQKQGEFVGYCNGLSCFRNTITELAFFIDVWNDTTQEVLRIIPPVIQHSKGGGIGGGGIYKLMSCGFGFDSINNEYKLVIIVFMFETKTPKCFVFTFGIKSSWTEVRSPNSGLLRTCASAVFTSYGAAGAGALFWWTTDPQVILLFDLHEDKLQYIRIPLKRNTHTRWFEYEGFLVVATLEKKSPTTLTLGKVHLKILKAYKDDQVWAEETIDLSAYSIPFSNNFRFVSFSDQILLYWVDAKKFHFFNLQRRCRKVVRNLDSCISEKVLPTVVRPNDYWLNCEVENICALKTLLPVRAQISDRAALNPMMMKSLENMWTLQQPKTVGGFFTSYYKSKTNSHYFFDD